ncbi:MAG: DUF3592 domain-containing protein [Anaerolineae bacterium]|nr:DUF3592 domain-containing protein [Anaerolineae bacterium]
MELLFISLFCLAPLLIFGWIAFQMIRRMSHFQEILADGVETDATVVHKYWRGYALGHRHRVVYEYRDASGATHRHDEAVFPSEYAKLQVGDALRVVYSTKRPHLCASAEAVARSRAAQR